MAWKTMMPYGNKIASDILQQNLHSQDKLHLVMMYYPFDSYRIWSTKILLRLFYIEFLRDISLQFCVFVMSLYYFGIQGNAGLLNQAEKYFLLFNFMEDYILNCCYFFFKQFLEFTNKIIQVWLFLWEEVFNYNFNFFNIYRVIQFISFFQNELW